MKSLYLESLALTGFRNYVSLNLPLGPGTFILWGDNAQGKSNILEAVYMLATTKSSRGFQRAGADQLGNAG